MSSINYRQRARSAGVTDCVHHCHERIEAGDGIHIIFCRAKRRADLFVDTERAAQLCPAPERWLVDRSASTWHSSLAKRLADTGVADQQFDSGSAGASLVEELT